MAMRTERAVVCECGHAGILHCKENDAPYSTMYEDYSLQGFDAEEISVTVDTKRPPHLLAAMKPKCLECGQIGKVTYA
jgi:hypothetical protein